MNMKLKVITTREEFYTLKEAWNKLLTGASGNSVYLTWEWLYTWWEFYGDADRDLHIILIEEDNHTPVAIAPFLIHKKRVANIFSVKVFEFLGTGEDPKDEVCSNYMNIILKKHTDEVMRMIAEHIVAGFKNGDWDEVSLVSTPGGSLDENLLKYIPADGLQKKVCNQISCAGVKLPHSWEDYMKTLSKSWRDQIKRGRKEIAERGEVSCSTIKAPLFIKEAFEQFIELHQGKWQSQGESGLFVSKRFADFHRKIIQLFAGNGWVNIHKLMCNGKTVAASYDYIYNNTVYFYLPAYDQDFKTKIGLGLIERSYHLEECIKQGVEFYDFYKAKAGSYKWHLAKDKKEVVDIVIYKKNFQYFIIFFLKGVKAVLRRVKKTC